VGSGVAAPAIVAAMDVNSKGEALLAEARTALAGMDTADRSVEGMVGRIGSLRYSEGRLLGFLDALLITDPTAARGLAPKIDLFIGEAIAARLLQG